VLRKMKPTRQVECVELMLTANNMTVAYAEPCWRPRRRNLLVGETKPRKISGVTAEQMVKMEREMGNMHEQLKLVEKSYGQDVLLLVLARGYLGKLIGNKAVFRFLSQTPAGRAGRVREHRPDRGAGRQMTNAPDLRCTTAASHGAVTA
jgi:hypothetical protein